MTPHGNSTTCKQDESLIIAADMKFIRRTAGYTHLNMMILNTQTVMELTEHYRFTLKYYALKCPTTESYYKRSVTKQKDKDL